MIKYLITDVDGVWTDGSFYYTDQGDLIRRFNVADGFGVRLAQLSGKEVIVLSGEQNPAVISRFNKLSISKVNLGISNKRKWIDDFIKDTGICLDQIAYIGDDLNDYWVFNALNNTYCPQDAHPIIKSMSKICLTTKGGKGVFREFVEEVLKQENCLDHHIKELLETYNDRG